MVRSRRPGPCILGPLALLLATALAAPPDAAAAAPGGPVLAPGKVLGAAHASGGLLRNTDFPGEGTPTGWSTFDPGDRFVQTEGTRALLCEAAPGRTSRGATQVVRVDQARPYPLVAWALSRCQGVPGPAGVAYSLYLDLAFADGSTSFAHCGFFSPGTHGWERRQVRLFPSKPIREIAFHLIFRSPAGTALFREPCLVELRPQPDALPYDGVLVAPPAARPAVAPDLRIASAGLALGFEASTGRVVRVEVAGERVSQGSTGGFLVRDQAAGGGFQPVLGHARREGGRVLFAGSTPGRDLAVEATFEAGGSGLTVDATVRDQTGRDRAVTLYLSLPVRRGLTWWDDPRRSRPGTGGEPLENTVPHHVAGAGWVSRYPLACLSGRKASLCVGLPLGMPRFSRLTYYPGLQEMVAAWDLGLSRRVRRAPSRAHVAVVLYTAPADWGFRAALAGYHRLFPREFAKRIPKEGLWIFLPGANGVRRPEDFGFAYQEGAAAARWDEQHGLLTFAYTEPVSFWMSLPKEKPRTEEACQEHLERLSAEEMASGKPGLARSAQVSACRSPEGDRAVVVVNAFGIDGGMWILNPNPAIPGQGKALSAGRYKLEEVRAAIRGARERLPTGWESGQGAAIDTRVKHGGARSLRVTLDAPGGWAGTAQRLDLNQERPEPLVLAAWSRAEGMQGARGDDYAVYVDFTYADGTPLFAQTVTFDTGTHGWQYSEHEIRPAKPLKSATVNCFLRRTNAGTAWFDGVFLGTRGGTSLLANGSFDGPLAPPAEVDGAYIDSLEMAGARMDFDPGHIAHAGEPLTFEPSSGQVGVANIVAQYEFIEALAREMHGQGKWMLANDVLRTFPWFAAQLDVLGTETTWFTPDPKGGPSAWAPMSDAELLYRRSMSARKPYCFLQNTPFGRLTLELVERYLMRSLFYAIYPGMFAGTDTGGHYFANPEWYERDRALFKRVVPLVRILSRAGWEPVTRARTDRREVLVERYGRPPGPVYLAVMNDSPKPRDYVLTVERSLSAGRVIRPVLSRSAPGMDAAGRVVGHLEPWGVQVLEWAAR